MVDRVVTLPLAWFHERRSGELVGRLASDVTVSRTSSAASCRWRLRNAVQMIGALVMLFVIDVRLTLLMLAIVPPIDAVDTMSFGRKIRTMTRGVQDELANVSGQVQEAIGGDRDRAGVRARAARGAALSRAASKARFARRSSWCAGASWFFRAR